MQIGTAMRTVSMIASAAILLLCRTEAFAQTASLRCDFYKQFGCMAQRCTDITTMAWSLINFEQKKYAICDKASCQSLDFVPWADGIYRALSFPGRELMFKINLSDSSIIETSTYLSNSITSFGNCSADRNVR
jgi:hypothetical protein